MGTRPIADARATINKLIDVCRDGQYGFQMAAKGVQDPILRAELLQYSGQRDEFAAELGDAIRAAGEECDDRRTVASLTNRAVASLKQAAGASDRAGVLEACQRSEVAAVEAYRRALASGLPAEFHAVVNAQLQAIHRVHDRLHSLYEIARGAQPD